MSVSSSFFSLNFYSFDVQWCSHHLIGFNLGGFKILYIHVGIIKLNLPWNFSWIFFSRADRSCKRNLWLRIGLPFFPSRFHSLQKLVSSSTGFHSLNFDSNFRYKFHLLKYLLHKRCKKKIDHDFLQNMLVEFLCSVKISLNYHISLKKTWNENPWFFTIEFQEKRIAQIFSCSRRIVRKRINFSE